MAKYTIRENELRNMVKDAIKEVVTIGKKPQRENRNRRGGRLYESAGGGIIEKWNYWCTNYHYDFIEKAWADDKVMAEHLKSKFLNYYDSVGPYGVMVKFYLNLDSTNRAILEDYVMNNYKG